MYIPVRNFFPSMTQEFEKHERKVNEIKLFKIQMNFILISLILPYLLPIFSNLHRFLVENKENILFKIRHAISHSYPPIVVPKTKIVRKNSTWVLSKQTGIT